MENIRAEQKRRTLAVSGAGRFRRWADLNRDSQNKMGRRRSGVGRVKVGVLLDRVS
jgi:hypothetical protein